MVFERIKTKVEFVVDYLKKVKVYDSETLLIVETLNVLEYLDKYQLKTTEEDIDYALKQIKIMKATRDEYKEVFIECFSLND